MSEMTISEQELLSKKLSEEIDGKRTQVSNLETQIISLERQKSAEKNVDNARHQEARNRALQTLADERNAVSKEKNEWHRKNERLNEQRQMMEKHEKEIGDVKILMAKLQEERREIYALRKEAEEIMRKAKEEWGEIEGFKQSQKAMKEDLESQIALNKKKYGYLMDSIGEIEKREKEVSIRESNCRALEMKHDKQEVASG